MTDIVERPKSIFNRTSAEVIQPYEPEGPGLSPDQFRVQLETMLANQDGAAHEFVKAVYVGTAPRERVTGFAADLHALVVRGAALDGLVAFAGDWHGLDMVVRLTHPVAVAFGYWDVGPTASTTIADATLDLAAGLGLDRKDVIQREPSTPVAMWLRMREAWAQQGLEAALATSAPQFQWAQAGSALAEGLVGHYGVSEEAAVVLHRMARVNEIVSRDWLAILTDVARSRYHQRVILRALRESISLWAYVWRQWMNGDAAPLTATLNTTRSQKDDK